MPSISQRSSDGYRKLMEQVIAGNGLAGIAATLARLGACDAVVADEELNPSHCYDGTGVAIDRNRCQLDPSLKRGIAFELQKERASAEAILDPGVALVQDDSGLYAVAPVVLSEGLAGYVWVRMAARVHNPDEELTTLVSEAAAACAIELVRQRAILEGEQRVRNSFLEDLLSGRLSSVSATRRRAKFLGYDLMGTHIVFVLDMDRFREFVAARTSDEQGVQRIKHRFRQAVENWLDQTWGSQTMVWEHSDSLVVLSRGDSYEHQMFMQRVETLRSHVQMRLSGPTISAGVGDPRSDLGDLKSSFAEAEHAAHIGSAVYGDGTTTAYRELGVYRLLFHLRDQPELLSFCNETIGRLEAYDRRHEGRLVETVQTYLDLQGNVTRAAEVLHLHRNGLLYRLNRIENLAGISLDDPSDRLALQLALLARPLLKKGAAEAPKRAIRLAVTEEESA